MTLGPNAAVPVRPRASIAVYPEDEERADVWGDVRGFCRVVDRKIELLVNGTALLKQDELGEKVPRRRADHFTNLIFFAINKPP